MLTHSYTICNCADEDIFHKQCEALEKYVPGIQKDGKLLEDVDGSLIQIYNKDGNKIRVLSDTEVDAVFVKSEIELTQFFNK